MNPKRKKVHGFKNILNEEISFMSGTKQWCPLVAIKYILKGNFLTVYNTICTTSFKENKYPT
jgi:hypothetical protein